MRDGASRDPLGGGKSWSWAKEKIVRRDFALRGAHDLLEHVGRGHALTAFEAAHCCLGRSNNSGELVLRELPILPELAKGVRHNECYQDGNAFVKPTYYQFEQRALPHR